MSKPDAKSKKRALDKLALAESKGAAVRSKFNKVYRPPNRQGMKGKR